MTFFHSPIILSGIAILSMLSPPTFADEFVGIRPHIGVGYATASGNGASGTSFHVGTRILFGAEQDKYYGLEVTYIDAYASEDDEPDTQYLAVGVVLERKMFKSFNAGVGTIGYLGIGDNSDNPFGLVATLAWEPEYKGMIIPFISFRSDLIFDDSTIDINSLSAGIRLRF
jgi:hypothetical protein